MIYWLDAIRSKLRWKNALIKILWTGGQKPHSYAKAALNSVRKVLGCALIAT